MAWSPKYIDKPLRFIFDPETWGLSFLFMGILIFVFGINQTAAMGLMLVFGYFLQKISDRNRRGYLLHLINTLGLSGIFPCKNGKYKF